LEKKQTEIRGWEDRKRAYEVIEECVKRFQQKNK
jgi:inorganic pyrophosphatase